MSLNQRSKTQPLDKTFLTEFKCTLADVNLRRRMLGGSIAKRISVGTSFASGDETCGPGVNEAFIIEKVETAVVIQSFQDLLLSISYDGGALVSVPCSGLFIFYGKIDRIEVRSATPTRFSYVRS